MTRSKRLEFWDTNISRLIAMPNVLVSKIITVACMCAGG